MSTEIKVRARANPRRADNECPWCDGTIPDTSHEMPNGWNGHCPHCGHPIRRVGRKRPASGDWWIRREGEPRKVTGFGSKTDEMVYIIGRMNDIGKLSAILIAVIKRYLTLSDKESASASLNFIADKIRDGGFDG